MGYQDDLDDPWADLATKQQALNMLEAPDLKPNRYQPTDAVMKFLQGL